MRLSDFLKVALALSRSLVPEVDAIRVARYPDHKLPTSDANCAELSATDLHKPAGCDLNDQPGSDQNSGTDNQWKLHLTAIDKDNVDNKASAAIAAKEPVVVEARAAGYPFISPIVHNLHASQDLDAIASSMVGDLAKVEGRGITQGPGDHFSTVPLPTGPDPTWHKQEFDGRQVTQAASDTFSTVILPTDPSNNPEPSWSKQKIRQESSEQLSTTPIPIASVSLLFPNTFSSASGDSTTTTSTSTTQEVNGSIITFTNPLPSTTTTTINDPIETTTSSSSSAQQTQFSPVRFSTVPIPCPTNNPNVSPSFACVVRNPSSQNPMAGPSNTFHTISFPTTTGPAPTWSKRQHITQEVTDRFSTVALPTGPDPTWIALPGLA